MNQSRDKIGVAFSPEEKQRVDSLLAYLAQQLPPHVHVTYRLLLLYALDALEREWQVMNLTKKGQGDAS